MQSKKLNPMLSFILILILVSLACSSSAGGPVLTDTPAATATDAATPTNTPRPSPTLRPTKTPDLAATQKYEAFNAEAQSYFDNGYFISAEGQTKELDDFKYDWAQLGWYNWFPLNQSASNFYISAHFTWSSAYRNADTSGCGFLFAIQENGDHYAVFLDRTKILFLNADSASSYSKPVGLTRGNGRVKFDNPADNPVEADFTVIVNNMSAYVLVDGELVGQYTLAQSKILKGDIALSILSGTNKDYGTRCEMTNIHIFIPK